MEAGTALILRHFLLVHHPGPKDAEALGVSKGFKTPSVSASFSAASVFRMILNAEIAEISQRMLRK